MRARCRRGASNPPRQPGVQGSSISGERHTALPVHARALPRRAHTPGAAGQSGEGTAASHPSSWNAADPSGQRINRATARGGGRHPSLTTRASLRPHPTLSLMIPVSVSRPSMDVISRRRCRRHHASAIAHATTVASRPFACAPQQPPVAHAARRGAPPRQRRPPTAAAPRHASHTAAGRAGTA